MVYLSTLEVDNTNSALTGSQLVGASSASATGQRMIEAAARFSEQSSDSRFSIGRLNKRIQSTSTNSVTFASATASAMVRKEKSEKQALVDRGITVHCILLLRVMNGKKGKAEVQAPVRSFAYNQCFFPTKYIYRGSRFAPESCLKSQPKLYLDEH